MTAPSDTIDQMMQMMQMVRGMDGNRLRYQDLITGGRPANGEI